jgi:hypothetical protein
MGRRLEGSRFGLWLYDPAVFVQFACAAAKPFQQAAPANGPGAG